MPAGADLVYIDGPAGKRFLGIKGLSSQRMIYSDVLDYLARGERPGLIVVDGRVSTVDAICEVATDDYCFRAPRTIPAGQPRANQIR